MNWIREGGNGSVSPALKGPGYHVRSPSGGWDESSNAGGVFSSQPRVLHPRETVGHTNNRNDNPWHIFLHGRSGGAGERHR